MNLKPLKGVFKHIDFILIDLICLQVCFVLAFWMITDYTNPYTKYSFFFLAQVMLLAQLLVILFSGYYKSILKRGYFDEFISVVKYAISIILITVVFLFMAHRTDVVSRLQTGTTIVLYIIIDYILRIINKRRLYKKVLNTKNKQGRSLILITSGKLVDDAMFKLTDPSVYHEHFVSGIVLIDGDRESIEKEYDIPIVDLNDESKDRIRSRWVDEVFVLQPDDYKIDTDLMNDLTDMGITVHICPEFLQLDNGTSIEMRKLGKFRVLTSSLKFVSAQQMYIKRGMDILGGIVGCILTGILFIFVAPAIYSKSPGPIFFKQDRVGLNGRVFKMYKFRSMYTDAEERKAALMEQNEMKDDLMFKMADDPRIIGSEKKDKNGKPKGIGNFIRNTSIDEFPQFFNVLKGDMSLVGTRPPLLSEWEQYDMKHRARMTIKPGITGLWQISGRSEITDFNEIVRLDREYIENWSVKNDIKILLKTIVVVMSRKGAS